jgi:precorrin-4 methylase
LIHEEQAELRARLAIEEQKKVAEMPRAREAKAIAAIDAGQEKLREAEGIRAAISASITALAASAQLAPAKLTLSKKAAEAIVTHASSGKMEWQEAIGHLTKLASLDAQAVKLLRESQAMLTRHVGDPDEHIIPTGYDSAPVTRVDGVSASRAMGGPENLRQAIKDLAEGNMTELAMRLVGFQSENGNQPLPSKPRALPGPAAANGDGGSAW